MEHVSREWAIPSTVAAKLGTQVMHALKTMEILHSVRQTMCVGMEPRVWKSLDLTSVATALLALMGKRVILTFLSVKK
jgi:hypothetical protein